MNLAMTSVIIDEVECDFQCFHLFLVHHQVELSVIDLREAQLLSLVEDPA